MQLTNISASAEVDMCRYTFCSSRPFQDLNASNENVRPETSTRVQRLPGVSWFAGWRLSLEGYRYSVGFLEENK